MYSNWLEECGNLDRAEFIRVQIDLANGAAGARCKKLQAREEQLLARHANEWVEPLREFFSDMLSDPYRFRRGFVERIVEPMRPQTIRALQARFGKRVLL